MQLSDGIVHIYANLAYTVIVTYYILYGEIMGKLKDVKDEVIKKYSEGMNCCEIGRFYNVNSGVVNTFLRKNGVEIRDISYRKYSLQEDYFSIINTEDRAYFLGLLESDGCNSPRAGTITISLQAEDIDILDKFNTFIASNKPLSYISNLNKKDGCKRKPQFRLSVSSVQMSNDLTNLGCMPAKSLILKFPTEEQVPHHLLKHWLRGMWDGDGSYSLWQNRIGNIVFDISFVGTKDVCLGIQEFISKSINVDFKLCPIKNKSVKRLKIVGGRIAAQKFLEWLYLDSKIYLNRKYNKAIEILNLPTQKTYEHDGKIKTLVEFSEIYNIPYQLIQKRIKRGWTIYDALTKVNCRISKKRNINNEIV